MYLCISCVSSQFVVFGCIWPKAKGTSEELVARVRMVAWIVGSMSTTWESHLLSQPDPDQWTSPYLSIFGKSEAKNICMSIIQKAFQRSFTHHLFGDCPCSSLNRWAPRMRLLAIDGLQQDFWSSMRSLGSSWRWQLETFETFISVYNIQAILRCYILSTYCKITFKDVFCKKINTTNSVLLLDRIVWTCCRSRTRSRWFRASCWTSWTSAVVCVVEWICPLEICQFCCVGSSGDVFQLMNVADVLITFDDLLKMFDNVW